MKRNNNNRKPQNKGKQAEQSSKTPEVQVIIEGQPQPTSEKVPKEPFKLQLTEEQAKETGRINKIRKRLQLLLIKILKKTLTILKNLQKKKVIT